MKLLMVIFALVLLATTASATVLSSSTVLKESLGNGVVNFTVAESGIAGSSAQYLVLGLRYSRLPSGQFGLGYDLTVDCRRGQCEYDLSRSSVEVGYKLNSPQNQLTGRYRVEIFDAGNEVVVRVDRDGQKVVEFRDTSPVLRGSRGTAVVNLYSFDTRPGVVLGQRSATDDASPFWRAYNPSADYHFFTLSFAEYQNALRGGYRGEGAVFLGMTTPQPGSAPLFRLYNANNGRHYFTMSVGERDYLVGRGWVYEQIAGYLFPTSSSLGNEVFKLYNNNNGAHLYVSSAAEKDAILNRFRGTWVQHTSLGRSP